MLPSPLAAFFMFKDKNQDGQLNENTTTKPPPQLILFFLHENDSENHPANTPYHPTPPPHPQQLKGSL